MVGQQGPSTRKVEQQGAMAKQQGANNKLVRIARRENENSKV
jgi:hypothetical protein